MICITDVNCKKHYIHKDAIAHIVDAGPNWQKISTYVKLFDGGTIEACERAAEIHAQIERTQPAEPVSKKRPETTAEHIARDMREGRFPNKSDPIQVPVEPVKVPSFDDWFKERNGGLSFDEAHMADGALIDKSMKELSRQMLDYVTEMVNEKVR